MRRLKEGEAAHLAVNGSLQRFDYCRGAGYRILVSVKLKGQTVVIKSRKENVIVGALTSLNKRVLKFYTAYTFTIQAIEWEDFVQHDETN